MDRYWSQGAGQRLSRRGGGWVVILSLWALTGYVPSAEAREITETYEFYHPIAARIYPVR